MKFLGHPYFLQFCIPLVAVTASVLLKFVSRNNVHKAFKKEDLAVGLNLSVTALLIFIAASSKLAQDLAKTPLDATLLSKASGVPWILALFIVGIWGVSTVVRKLGWEKDDELHKLWGIAVPDVFGVLVLLFVVNWIS